MHWIINLVLVAIVLFCGWRGWRNGFIRGIFGLLALVVALYGANFLASAYSGEFAGMLKPFVGGVVDTTFADMIEERAAGLPGAMAPARTTDEDAAFDTSVTMLRRIGLPVPAAEHISYQVAGVGTGRIAGLVTEAITTRLSATLSFVVIFAIAFLLLMIIFSVVGNLINLVFTLPGLRLLDAVAGALFGLFKGVFIILVFGAIIRYIGVFLPEEWLADSGLLNYLIHNNPIANFLGI